MTTESFRAPGRFLTLTAPYARATSGLGALVGAIFGVSMDTVANGVEGQFDTEGEHYLLKTSAQAWTAGDRLYWNAGTKLVDNDPTTGQFIGVATAAAANPSASGYIKLAGNAPELAEGKQAAVVVLTDSTGGSGTHDDTLADGLTSVAPAAVAAYAAVVNMTDPVTKAEGEAVSAALATLRDSVEAQRAIIATLVTDATTQNQNDSDLAQKILEIRSVLVTAGLITA